MKPLKDLVSLGENELLSSSETCELLRISAPTLRKLANAGQIPFVKLGNKPMSHRKFRLLDIAAFVSKSLSTNN
jgi:excisionase family DNA binding protein